MPDKPDISEFEQAPQIMAFPAALISQLEALRAEFGSLAPSPDGAGDGIVTLGIFETRPGEKTGWYGAAMGINVPLIPLTDGRYASAMCWTHAAMAAREEFDGEILTAEQLETLRVKPENEE